MKSEGWAAKQILTKNCDFHKLYALRTCGILLSVSTLPSGVIIPMLNYCVMFFR